MENSARNRRVSLSSIPGPSGRSQSSRRKSVAVVGDDGALVSNQRAIAKKPPVPTTSGVPSGPSGRRKSMLPRPGRENAPPLPPKPVESASNILSPSASSQVSRRSRMSFGSKRTNGNAQPSEIRPVSDRKFLQKCIGDLLKFLQDNNYNMKVNSKTLSHLSSGDVENITKHMFRLIDSDFQRRSPMKFVEEVAAGFRFLGYPYTISRTSWVATQTNPIILALHWLGNHLRVHLEEEAIDYLFTEDLTFETFEELHNNTERAFFQYLKQSFTAFMRNNDPNLEELERALVNRFHHDDTIVSLQTDRQGDENADVLQEIEELQENEEQLAGLKQKYEDWKEKIEQMKTVCGDMKEYRMKNEEKKQQDLSALNEAEEALARAKEQLEGIKAAISGQKFSVKDIQKVEIQSKGYHESRQRYEESFEEQKSNLHKKQAELDRLVSELEAGVNELASISAPIVTNGDNLGLRIRFSVETFGNQTGESTFDADLKEGKEVLLFLKTEGEVALHSSKASNEGTLDQLNKSQVALKQSQAKVAAITSKVEHTKKSLMVLQTNQDLRRQEIVAQENETNQALEREAAFQREVVALEAKINRSNDDHELLMAAKYRDVEASIKRMEDHLLYMDEVVTDVHEYYKAKEHEVQSLSIRPGEC